MFPCFLPGWGDILYVKLKVTNHFRNQIKCGEGNIPEVAAGTQRFASLAKHERKKKNVVVEGTFGASKIFQRCLGEDDKTREKHVQIFRVQSRPTLNAIKMILINKCLDKPFPERRN